MVGTKGGGAYWKGVGDGGEGSLETWSYEREAYQRGEAREMGWWLERNDENEGFILTNHLSDKSLTNQKQFSCLVPNMILPLSVALPFYQPNVIS